MPWGKPGVAAELLAVAGPGRIAHARGERGAADLGQAGQRPGEPGGIYLALAPLASGGVGSELGARGVQQPHLGGDLGGQAREVAGGVAVLKLQGGLGALKPRAGAAGVLIAVGDLGDHRGQLGLGGPGQGARVGIVLEYGQAGGAEVPVSWLSDSNWRPGS